MISLKTKMNKEASLLTVANVRKWQWRRVVVRNFQRWLLADLSRSAYSQWSILLKSIFIRLDTLKSTSHPISGIKQLDRNGQQLLPVRRVRL
jgi:hypothetical protein